MPVAVSSLFEKYKKTKRDANYPLSHHLITFIIQAKTIMKAPTAINIPIIAPAILPPLQNTMKNS